MAIIASAASGGTKFLHPDGQFAAVCIDVIDLGMVTTQWNGKVKKQHKIVIRFWCGEYNEENQPLFVGERFTLSLSDKSALRPFLKAWRGREFTADELKAFDVEQLIGAPAYIQVAHRKAENGNVYANVESIMKLPKGSGGIMPLADYVRACDRPKDEQDHEMSSPTGPAMPSPFDPDDDDLPF